MTPQPDPGTPERDPPPPHDCDAAVRDIDDEDTVECRGSIRTGPFVVEWDVSRTEDATLVRVQVTNTLSVPRTVRIENRLDAPVLPPRRRGVPAVGWDDEGLTCRVPGDGRVSVGYACRAPSETPPVAVDDDPAEGAAADAPLDRALRSLGDHAPPRSVVSPAALDGAHDSDSAHDCAPSSDAVSESREPPARVAADADGRSADERAPGERGADAGHALSPPHPSTPAVPETVTAWFRAVEARLATADRLTGDVEDATPVVASLGGRPGVAVLASTLEGDAAALSRIATRASELADRVDAADVPDLEDSP
ncbi:hypothetical protein [Salinigranum sp.]|uniref:DUF7857 domain-containing protein n=1 Tax=Salinigranum sp. TaxID=1966351 RepID=UPI00356AFA5A